MTANTPPPLTNEDSESSVLLDSWPGDFLSSFCAPVTDEEDEESWKEAKSTPFILPTCNCNCVATKEEADSSEPSDTWHNALSHLCGPVTDGKECERDNTQETRDAAPQDDSAWRDAINLLCKAMVIDEDLEEEETLERIYWETRCAPVCACACGDSDNTLDDIVDAGDSDGNSVT